jgi:hypothetical protein
VKQAIHVLLEEGEEEAEEEEVVAREIPSNGEENKLAEEQQEAQEAVMSISLSAVTGAGRPDTFSVILNIEEGRQSG